MSRVTSLRPVRGTPAEVVEALRDWTDSGGEALSVCTSGSTGTPREVVLSRPALAASVAASHARLGGDGQWILALPATHVAGVQVVLRSLWAGHPPVLHEAPLADLATSVAVCSADRRYLSLVPTQLHRLLEEGAADALAGLDAVLLGGGPVDTSLRERAAEAGVRTVASYGMSETCGGCVYDGLPLDGVEVAVEADGRIRISGPVLFDRYDDPAATAEVLRDGWFWTSDAGRIDEAGRLQVLGRLDDMIVSGGVNVPGPLVARRLREHPGLDDAEVVGVPDAEWGTAVVAVVVGDVPLAELRDWVATTLPRAWAPHRVVRVETLPRLAVGKVDRLALSALAAERLGAVDG